MCPNLGRPRTLQGLPKSGDTPTNTTLPIVHVKDGEVFANSRDVAAFFGKDHKDVLASIRETCVPALSAEISAQWFQPIKMPTKVGFGTRWDDAFDMTRNGFTLLVMGYQGAKAMKSTLRPLPSPRMAKDALAATHVAKKD